MVIEISSPEAADNGLVNAKAAKMAVVTFDTNTGGFAAAGKNAALPECGAR